MASSRVAAVSLLADFLHRLLEQGSVILRERPVMDRSEHSDAAAWLQSIYMDYRLDVAGPLLPFDAAMALNAAECCRSACWFLVDRSAPPAEVEKLVTMPDATGSAAQHLSVDLIFRFLPQLHNRARAIEPDDVLTRALVKLCRLWPLSGVLADVLDKPLASLEFDGHPGLQLLYAERFADHPRPAWMPVGASKEYVDLILAERGDKR
jgi:hypothetical protein